MFAAFLKAKVVRNVKASSFLLLSGMSISSWVLLLKSFNPPPLKNSRSLLFMTEWSLEGRCVGTNAVLKASLPSPQDSLPSMFLTNPALCPP